jgi:phosphatidate cytidylyltransferase
VLTAVLGWPALALFLLRAPHWAFVALVMLVASFAVAELQDLAGPHRGGRTLATALALLVCATAAWSAPPSLVAAVAVASPIVAWAAVASVPSSSLEEAARRAGAAAGGLLYVVLPLSLLILMRRETGGAGVVTLLVLATWARDIGAFLAGKALPGRPLRPELSPRKHLAGALGGLLLAALAAFGLQRLVASRLDALELALLALVVGVFGQVGDLFESLLKRRAGERHSGRWLGDQGGILDSIDGLLLTAPAAYGCLQLARGLKALLAPL